MINHKSFIFCLLFTLIAINIFAQNRRKQEDNRNRTARSTLLYDNIDYCSYIKTVRIQLNNTDGSFPLLDLSKNDIFTISFDDLRADSRSFYYTVEHCNADWTPSRIPVMDYMSGYEEDRIYTIQSSENTKIPYSHYSFDFPNDNMRLKLAGNYILQVYEDADKSRLLFSRKLFVMNNMATTEISLVPSYQSSKRVTNQKLNIKVHAVYELINPNTNVQIHAYQNQRGDNIQIVKSASKISTNTLIYDLPNTFDFLGNNEFRTLDLRSVRNSSSQVKSLKSDSVYRAILETDVNQSLQTYNFKLDENGQFYIRNLDYLNADLEGEYISTYFSLKDSANIKGDIYLVGGFNTYMTSPSNKLTYNSQAKVWETTQLLKQGIYNYEYILKHTNSVLTNAFSGSYFDTENVYQVLIYYRKPGTYWDEIIGFKNFSKTNQ